MLWRSDAARWRAGCGNQAALPLEAPRMLTAPPDAESPPSGMLEGA